MPSRSITPDLQSAVACIRAGWAGAQAVWLFGSAAHGTATAASDVDLAVLAPRAIDALQRFELQRDLGVLLDRDVDLVDLAAANTVLRCEAVARGEVVWSIDPEVPREFTGRVLTEYGNWRDMTQPLREAIRRDGRIVAS